MIAFICSWTPADHPVYSEQFRTRVVPGIERQVYPPGEAYTVYKPDAKNGLAAAYNQALDWARITSGIHAAVFLHADLELVDPLFLTKVLDAFERKRECDTAIVGLIGGRRIQSIAWWEGQGVGRLHHGPDHDIQPGVYFPEREGEVDAVDGSIVCLSPWALANLRFDPVNYPGFHGWEVDICTLARSLGKKVKVIDSEAKHWCKAGYGDKAAFEDANNRYRRKWGRFLLRRRTA